MISFRFVHPSTPAVKHLGNDYVEEPKVPSLHNTFFHKPNTASRCETDCNNTWIENNLSSPYNVNLSSRITAHNHLWWFTN